jgi:ABC-type Fe3+/spermidine/putrescine transport system ATPase subunit
MRDGIIEQQGPAEAVFRRPRSGFIASFLGITNLLKGRVIEIAPDGARVEIGALGALSAFLADDVRTHLKPGDAACVSIRPLELTLSASRPAAAANAFEGQIVERIFLGDLTEYLVRSGEIRWRVHVASSTRFVPGDPVWISFAAEAGSVVLDS